MQLRLVRQQQAVLQTVQALKDDAAKALTAGKQDVVLQKNEEIVALIEAALRHDQAQPWMYELLALSMRTAGRPQADIDRAIMSAVEFTQNSSDLMYLGAYLVQAKMDRQALKIFHEVSQLEPFWPEPYFHGMIAARNLDDLDGLQWSTAGILSQAWPIERAKMWDEALRVAEAKLNDLRDSKRTDEANRFQAVLDTALIRDCVVRVQWTGDADIDVMVKEPGGTICSLRNPRTTSGGSLIGDYSPPDGKEKVGGHMAVYSCSQAFSGKYQVLVRRVFGNVPTGYVKVTADVHYNSPQAKETVWEKIPVKDGESLVTFDLSDGRRKESIRERQIVNAAVAAVGQMHQQLVLAQQLEALNDPNAASALAAAQQNSASASAAQSQPISPLAWPNVGRGAVGYQPVITTLPEGTNMSATAVVSADRRYVRITPVPVFSAISQVHTFSIDSGSTTSTPGVGTGGQGFSGATNGVGGLGGNGGGGGFNGGGGGGFNGGGGGGFGGGGVGF